MVITSALHAEGRGFEPRRDLRTFYVSEPEYDYFSVVFRSYVYRCAHNFFKIFISVSPMLHKRIRSPIRFDYLNYQFQELTEKNFLEKSQNLMINSAMKDRNGKQQGKM